MLVLVIIGAVISSSILITFGTVIGALLIMVVFITLCFITVTVILIRSKQALRMEFEHFKANMNEHPVIYEDLQESPPPIIDLRQNTAYISTISKTGTSM